LTGFSGILPYWDEQNDCISFKTINSYDLHIESADRYDERYSYSFREVELNYAAFVSWVDEGLLEVKVEDWQALTEKQSTRDGDLFSNRDVVPIANKESVLVYEYYCPIHKKLYRLIDNDIVFEAKVDDCPWLISLLFETPEDSYALSLLDSSLGLILANNILHNRRLDNMALSVDNMWLFVDDGVTNPEDIKAEPGKVITVGSPDAIQPMRPPANNFNITYDEEAVLDARIDRNIGTGAMISANSYRTGERVTAEEIKSVKDAGGNRLSDLYEHLEQTVIIPLLERSYKLLKANTSKSKIIKLASSIPNVSDYYKMLPEDLKHNYVVRVTGTQSVINRDRNISLITEFLGLVSSVPQFQELVDFSNLYTDLLVKFGFDDPQRYLKKAEPEAAPQPQSPVQALTQEAASIGGAPLAGAVEQQIAGGNLLPAISNLSGQLPGATSELPPELQAQAQAQLLTPQGNI
jgi:hypothetical protein